MAIKGTFQFPELAAKPSAPPVGSIILYVKTDNVLYIQDSSGTEYAFGSVDFISQLTGDVSAIGPGVATATVNSVGGSTAALIHSAELLANAATALNSANQIIKRDASGNYAANVGTLNALKLLGSVSGTLTVAAPATFSDWTFTLPTTAGTVGQALITDGTGASSWASVLMTALSDGKIWVGDSSNLAVQRTPSGDVSMSDVGAFTVNSVGGSTAALIHAAELLANAATSANTASAIVRRDASGNISISALAASSAAITGTSDMIQLMAKGFAGQGSDIFQVQKSDATVFFKVDSNGNATVLGTIAASNFSGSSSGTNTGDVTETDTDSIAISITGQNISANLKLSADAADSGNVKATATIHSGANAGLHVETPFGNPVNIGTSNNPGSAASVSLSDHVHAITIAIIGNLVLTGYTIGTNVAIAATDTIFQAFGKLQAQISATVAAAITSLTGDVTATGPGAAATTISVGAVTDTKASLSNKPAVTVVATTNQALTGTPTIDGQATTAGTSIVLLTAQSTGSQNGPWVVQTGAWTRPTWFPTGGTTQAFQFITMLVRLGTQYQGSTWRMTTAGAVTIDSTATVWAVTPQAGNYRSDYTIGPQSGSSAISLAFANAFKAILAWNPTANFTLTMPPTLPAAGQTLVAQDNAGTLQWSNPQINIDGGTAASVYTTSQVINGGTP